MKIQLNDLGTMILEFIAIVLLVVAGDHFYHMFDHRDVNHPYKIECMEGHEYIIMTNSYQGFMAPAYDINGKPRKCTK